MSRPNVKAQPFHVVILVAAAATVIIALVVPNQRVSKTQDSIEQDIKPRIAAVEAVIEASQSPEYVRVVLESGLERLYVRGLTDTDAEWAARVWRIQQGIEPDYFYLCTMLSSCQPPVSSLEVCTPCSVSPPSPVCVARHQASVAAFCEQFHCDACGD